jgi:hypothetical protein
MWCRRDRRPFASDSATQPVQLELNDATLDRLGELLRTFAVQPVRPIWPSGVAVVALVLTAGALYYVMVLGRTGLPLAVDTDLPRSSVTLENARWDVPAATAAEMEITQAVGGRVAVGLPIDPEDCRDMGIALGATDAQMSGCDEGELAMRAPLAIRWSTRPLLTTSGEQATAPTLSLLPLAGSADSADGLRLDVGTSEIGSRWCFHAAPDADMTVVSGRARFERSVDGGAVDCASGLTLVVGEERRGGAGPTVILKDVGTFRFEADSDQTSVADFAGVLDLGSGGSRTIDPPDTVRVSAGQGPLRTVVDFTAEDSRLKIDGDGVTEALIGAGDNAVPNWWERWRSLVFPVTTSLLAAAVTSFAMLISITTERIGRRSAERAEQANRTGGKRATA